MTIYNQIIEALTKMPDWELIRLHNAYRPEADNSYKIFPMSALKLFMSLGAIDIGELSRETRFNIRDEWFWCDEDGTLHSTDAPQCSGVISLADLAKAIIRSCDDVGNDTLRKLLPVTPLVPKKYHVEWLDNGSTEDFDAKQQLEAIIGSAILAHRPIRVLKYNEAAGVYVCIVKPRTGN